MTSIPHQQQETYAPAIALQMKASANQMYSAKNFVGAAEVYGAILHQFAQIMSPMLIRVVRCNRAACFIELGRYHDAIPDLQTVVQVAGAARTRDSVVVTQKAHYRLARCYCEVGRYGDALQEMEKYRELIGGQPSLAETALYTQILSGVVNSQQRDQVPRAAAGPSASAGVGIAHLNHANAAGHAERGRTAPARPPPDDRFLTLRYEIRIFNVPAPIIRSDRVPSMLCVASPPELPTRAFLAELVKKHHGAVMRLQPWVCWNCPARAVSLVHTPASYIHLEEPQVIDFAQPVCVNGGACEAAAREMMSREMRLVAAQAKTM